MGTAKATVFPEPVLLPPIQSRPFNISGIQPFWMPVGLFMAMAPKDPTSHGFTFRAEKLIVESSGANIAPLLVCLSFPLSWTLDFIRDGTDVVGIRGASTSTGEIFLRFREAGLSRESESEDSLSEGSESESDEEFESDASSSGCLIGTDLARAFGVPIICWQDFAGLLVARQLFFLADCRRGHVLPRA